MRSHENTANIDGLGKGRHVTESRLRLASLIGAVVYPWLIRFSGGAIDGYREIGSALFATAATVSLLLAASVPAFAAGALILTRHDSVISPVVTQGVLYLVFAVSPLYVFALQAIAMLGATRYYDLIWIVCWMAAAAVMHVGQARRAPRSDATGGCRLRMIHGSAAMCLLLGFLLAHLVNHDVALWSVKLHRVVMEWLRLWYRSEWLEPVLLTLLLVMVATGVPMVVDHSRRSADVFRIIQMATGVYLAIFLCAHVLAVLGARRAGIETDWRFATGANGLLDGRCMLIPYYIYATFFSTLHVGCGLRIVLMKHGVEEVIANKAVCAVAAAGMLITMPIAVAAFGFHVQSS